MRYGGGRPSVYQRIMYFLLLHLRKSIATAKIHNISKSAKKNITWDSRAFGTVTFYAIPPIKNHLPI